LAPFFTGLPLDRTDGILGWGFEWGETHRLSTMKVKKSF